MGSKVTSSKKPSKPAVEKRPAVALTIEEIEGEMREVGKAQEANPTADEWWANSNRLSELIDALSNARPTVITDATGQEHVLWDTPRFKRIMSKMVEQGRSANVDDAFLRSVTKSSHVPTIAEFEAARTLVLVICKAFLTGDARTWREIVLARDYLCGFDDKRARLARALRELVGVPEEIKRTHEIASKAARRRSEAFPVVALEHDADRVLRRLAVLDDRFRKLRPSSVWKDLLRANTSLAGKKKGAHEAGLRSTLAVLCLGCGAFDFTRRPNKSEREDVKRVSQEIGKALAATAKRPRRGFGY